jgi:hypothetical protein
VVRVSGDPLGLLRDALEAHGYGPHGTEYAFRSRCPAHDGDNRSALSVIRAHAILYQAQRERDDRGRIVATVKGDYQPIRDLVGDIIAEGVEATVTPAMRATVGAVQVLLDEGRPHVNPKALTDRLGVGRSATYDRTRRALLKGYLVNEAGKDERGKKLVIGSPLPGSDEFLPTPADVVRVMSSTPNRTNKQHGYTVSERLSGSPGRPAEPPDGLVVLGEEMYPVLLANAARDGHITASEFAEHYALHKIVVDIETGAGGGFNDADTEADLPFGSESAEEEDLPFP